ncbi:MAG: recombinase family protein [Agathobacter sp.]|nr:recombinase family protein [Agathobacter sp.]
MANIAYVRVSTVEQNEARQVEALQKYNIDKWFTEKVSGKNADRPQLQAMLDYVREGDTIHIHDFSRLARNTKDLLEIVELLEKKGVNLVSNHENIDSSTPSGKLMLTMIGAIAEFERANLLERQREGIAIAKAEGKYRGGQVKRIDEDLFNTQYERYMNREISKAQLARELNISRPTLDKLLKDKGLNK